MKRWIPVLLLAPAIASHAQAPTASERQRLEAAQALETLDWLKQLCDGDGFVVVRQNMPTVFENETQYLRRGDAKRLLSA